MPLPLGIRELIRCRASYFRDDGQPLLSREGRRCLGDWKRNQPCAWVHPEDPEWDRARTARIPRDWLEEDRELRQEEMGRERRDINLQTPRDVEGRDERTINALRLPDRDEARPSQRQPPPPRRRTFSDDSSHSASLYPSQDRQSDSMDVDAPGTSAHHAMQASTSTSAPAPPQLPTSLYSDPATEMAEREAWGTRVKCVPYTSLPMTGLTRALEP
ncbi:hypothetical protein K523DRAFT_248886 [Schizophyllum commune Tattone D]|nr:hypothetical protein K523DRAFT_248886 [Schizophyllum commune Tattone D]